MHIFVKTLTGKSVKLDVNATSEVAEVKSQIETLIGVPSEEQKLIFNGKSLIAGLLEENGVEDESNIHMVVDISGGAKGKKKKKDTKKRKKKHTKKKVKLAVLKYYKVEGDKVVRLKSQTQYGTFLADHGNRLYCGRTHVTYMKTQEAKGAAGKGKKK